MQVVAPATCASAVHSAAAQSGCGGSQRRDSSVSHKRQLGRLTPGSTQAPADGSLPVGTGQFSAFRTSPQQRQAPSNGQSWMIARNPCQSCTADRHKHIAIRGAGPHRVGRARQACGRLGEGEEAQDARVHLFLDRPATWRASPAASCSRAVQTAVPVAGGDRLRTRRSASRTARRMRRARDDPDDHCMHDRVHDAQRNATHPRLCRFKFIARGI